MTDRKFIFSDKNPSAPVAYGSFTAMHTRMEILFVHSDKNGAEKICRRMEDLADSLEKTFSRHLEGTQLHSLNKGTAPVSLSEDLYFAVELCEQFRRATSGYFDIAALSSTRERPALRTYPPTHQAQRSSEAVLIDFGGFAKGYALEKMRKLLVEEYGIGSALLNFGSSSILGIGSHPLGDCWMVSDEKERVNFRLKDSALSVSGRARSGKAHIMDPHTLATVEKDSDVAVTGSSALICEILSTALFAAPRNEWDAIMSHFDKYEIKELK